MSGVLSHPKWEAFALSYAEHGNGTKAAIEAGYSAGSNNMGAAVRASTLLKKPEVKARINELRQKVERKKLASASMDRVWILEKLKENAEQALEERDRSAANRALELLGREYGLFQERKIIQIGPLEALDAHRLQRLLLLAEAVEQGRLALPGANAMNYESSTSTTDVAREIIEGEVVDVPQPARSVPEDENADVLG